jgi:hypothetical protein
VAVQVKAPALPCCRKGRRVHMCAWLQLVMLLRPCVLEPPATPDFAARSWLLAVALVQACLDDTHAGATQGVRRTTHRCFLQQQQPAAITAPAQLLSCPQCGLVGNKTAPSALLQVPGKCCEVRTHFHSTGQQVLGSPPQSMYCRSCSICHCRTCCPPHGAMGPGPRLLVHGTAESNTG